MRRGEWDRERRGEEREQGWEEGENMEERKEGGERNQGGEEVRNIKGRRGRSRTRKRQGRKRRRIRRKGRTDGDRDRRAGAEEEEFLAVTCSSFVLGLWCPLLAAILPLHHFKPCRRFPLPLFPASAHHHGDILPRSWAHATLSYVFLHRPCAHTCHHSAESAAPRP